MHLCQRRRKTGKNATNGWLAKFVVGVVTARCSSLSISTLLGISSYKNSLLPNFVSGTRSRFVVKNRVELMGKSPAVILLLLIPLLILQLPGRCGLVAAASNADVNLPDGIVESVRHPEYGLRSWGIRDEERDAYYRVLQHARDTNLKDQMRAADQFRQQRRDAIEFDPSRSKQNESFPVYYDLFQNEEVYHGQPVTLTGHVRRLISYRAGENPYGIETLYEAWLYTDDSQHHPAIIVATSVPDGVSMGSEDFLLDNVSVTGYFFKMYGYEAKDTNRFAPLILAQRIIWSPPDVEAVSPVTRVILSVVVCTVILMAVVVWWWIAKKDRKSREEYRRLMSDPDDAPTFENG